MAEPNWRCLKVLVMLYFTDLRAVLSTSASTIPKIQIRSDGKGDLGLIQTTIGNKTAYYIKEYLYSYTYEFFDCSADYPIKWNITGFAPFLDVYSENYSSTYAHVKLHSDKIASLTLACERIENSNVRNEVLFFYSTNVTNSFPEPDTSVVTNSKIIPCTTADPVEPVELFLITSNESSISVSKYDDSLQYNPAKGFLSDNVFEGKYICKQKDSSVFLSAIVADENALSEVSAWSEDTIKLKCPNVLDQPVKFIFSEFETQFISTSCIDYLNRSNCKQGLYEQWNSRGLNYSVNLVIEFKENETIGELSVEMSGEITHVKGTAECVSSDDKRSLKAWNFLFVRTPIVSFATVSKNVWCQWPPFVTEDRIKIEKFEFKIFDCGHVSECAFIKSHALKPIGNGDYKTCEIKEFSNSCGDNAVTKPVGLARFSLGGLMKQWEYMIPLDHVLYFTWSELPSQKMMRMDAYSEVYYTNEISIFKCKPLRTLFPGHPMFEVEFQNGSRENVKKFNLGVANMSEENDGSSYFYNLNIYWELKIYLPIDVVAVHCVVFWWNSPKKLTVSHNFITKTLQKPEIFGYVNGSISKEIFFVGDTNRRLSCDAVGVPEPQYFWYFNDTITSVIFPELETSVDSRGVGSLDFPEIRAFHGKKYGGEYKCVAKNKVGKAEKSFLLSISDSKNQSGTFSVLGILAICAVIILLVVVVILIIKYRREKEIKRHLTEAEVAEFFHGRPDLLGNGVNSETLEFLPYNKNYEILFSDLEFTLSDKNMLGSGEYAFVVRGLIISKGKAVALKIPKPSTNINLFKSLLSEVKIMSYIGKHENLLELIGVCTEGIKTRSIYIATDICSLGSLKAFLIKSRPNFIDLIDINQEIDPKAMPRNHNSQHLTTMDLVSFCAQIAEGMAYLTYKSVIHGDLATRNVLLTSEKVAKVSDFGLSKRLYGSENYVKKTRVPLPWRWMALESLETYTFSVKSDVWAYGVTLYEIFTLGGVPFPNEHWSSEFIHRLKGGLRMGRPEFSTPQIYHKIVTCWENKPELRPGFETLLTWFDSLYKAHASPSCQELLGESLDKNNMDDCILDDDLSYTEVL